MLGNGLQCNYAWLLNGCLDVRHDCLDRCNLASSAKLIFTEGQDPVSDSRHARTETTKARETQEKSRIVFLCGTLCPPWLRFARSHAPLRLCITLAVRPRSAQGKKQNVQVTEDRQKECMMNANPIGNRALHYRDNGSAHYSHDHDSGTVSGERPKLGHSQSEDAREHDRVEEPDQNDAVHRKVPGGQHRDPDQRGRAHRADAKQPASTYFLQDCRPDEAADHRAAPVESHEASRNFVRETANLRLREVIHQETSDGNLAADIHEDGDRA